MIGTGTDSGNSSPALRPAESSAARSNDSPHSSAPSTPEDRASGAGQRRADAVKIEGEDYFLSVGRFGGPDSKSAPITPQSVSKNIVFSPRIQFHETWPSGEYDRRGDIATCNRLTPLLAQQIKEELNTFKMVRQHLRAHRVGANEIFRRWKSMRRRKSTPIFSR